MTLPIALLLADARLPVAGHTQSNSLEPALHAGLDAIPEFMALRLRTVARTEAATAVVARAMCGDGRDLADVVTAWAARTPSKAMRDTSREQGRALRRLAERIWPVGDLPPAAPRPVVLGAVAHTTGLDAASLVQVVGYDDLQTVAAAALKLRPRDPVEVAGWVVEALPLLDVLADDCAHLVAPDQIPATSSPMIEQLAEVHAITSRRLFRA